MEKNTMEHGMNSELGIDNIENLLQFDPSDFDLDISGLSFTSPPPPPPLPPVTTERPVGANLMSIQDELQLLSLSSDSDQSNVPDTRTYRGGNNGGETVSRRRHKLSVSANGSSTTSSCVMKRSYTVEQLSELANTNPMKAKRIVANRKSAARSKERKTRQAAELEERVQSLQMFADCLNKEFGKFQSDNEELRTSNNLVKVHIQSMTDESKRLDAILKSIKEEENILKIKIDQHDALMGSNPSVSELVSQFSSQLALQQQVPNTQSQLQAAPQQPQLLSMPPPPPPPSSFGEPFSEHFIGSSFSNYNPLN